MTSPFSLVRGQVKVRSSTQTKPLCAAPLKALDGELAERFRRRLSLDVVDRYRRGRDLRQQRQGGEEGEQGSASHFGTVT